MHARLLLFAVVVAAGWAAVAAPSVAERVPHDEHDIPDSQIIDLPVGSFPEPVCEYSVHWRDRRGPLVSHTVRLGDPLYHRWRCYYPNPAYQLNFYCMLVHNCTVSNARTSVQIIDAAGCSLYPTVVPDLVYPASLEGGLASSAFSLDVDQPNVHFNCAIRLLIKDNGLCPRPACPFSPWFSQ